jgi:hypothetical protein
MRCGLANIPRETMAGRKRHPPPDRAATYTVGYARPPAHTRFAKGRSGNPGGRPRQARDIAARLVEALDEPAAGTRGRLSNRDAIIDRLIANAVAGDMRAARLVLDLAGQIEPEPDPERVEDARVRLIRALDRLAAEVAEPGGSGAPEPAAEGKPAES